MLLRLSCVVSALVSFATFACAGELHAPSTGKESSSHQVGDASGWSFRLQEGSIPQKGLLQVLPPHETEWGTVCGDTIRANELLRAGSSTLAAGAAFFSPFNAVIACHSAGHHVKRASAYRLSASEGWGAGPSYMSHVSCDRDTAHVAGTLAECYFTLSLSAFINTECERADDVYIDCSADLTDNAELDDALAKHEDAKQQLLAQRREFEAQASNVPSTVVVVSLDVNATVVATNIAALVGQSKSVVTISMASPNTTLVQQGYSYPFGYFTVGFTSVSSTPAPASGSDTGGTTEAPSVVTADTIMTTFLATASSTLLGKRIYEVRPATQAAYGTIPDSSDLVFRLDAPSSAEKFGAITATGFGYLRATASGNSAYSSLCNVSSSDQNRYITASWVCGALGFTTIPSMLIPNFGEFNLGYMGISQLRRVASGYTRSVASFYNKPNNCSNADTYGIICGAGNFEQDTTDPPQLQFCVTTTVFDNGFTALLVNLYRELLIPAYRILKIRDNSGELCFRVQYGYSYKDATPTLDFSIVDIQYILSSLNTEGWKLMTGSTDIYGITLTQVATMPMVPVEPAEVTFMTNLTAPALIQALLDYFAPRAASTLMYVDALDIVLEFNETVPGSLPQKPAPTTAAPPPSTLAPTTMPTPAPPVPTRKNKKNKTMTHSMEVSISHEITVSDAVTVTPNQSSAAPTTLAPPASTTPAPDDSTVNLITLRFMFKGQAQLAFDIVSNKTLLPWVAFTTGGLHLITPAPPPPDETPLITGLVFAGLIVLVLLVVAAVFIKRLYYTRTPKRWDDDYVMMNTQVLTIPLNTIEMETPVRRHTSRAKEVNTSDRDTADLF